MDLWTFLESHCFSIPSSMWNVRWCIPTELYTHADISQRLAPPLEVGLASTSHLFFSRVLLSVYHAHELLTVLFLCMFFSLWSSIYTEGVFFSCVLVVDIFLVWWWWRPVFWCLWLYSVYICGLDCTDDDPLLSAYKHTHISPCWQWIAASKSCIDAQH